MFLHMDYKYASLAYKSGHEIGNNCFLRVDAL